MPNKSIHLLTFSFIIIFCISVFAQKTKYAPRFIYGITTEKVVDAQPLNKSLFVKGDPNKIKSKVSELGGSLKYCHGNICAISIPSDYIDKFLMNDFVQRVEQTVSKSQPLMDTSLINNGILAVHQGVEPFKEGLTGKGVIVGIIDDGIDVNHFDFKNKDSTSRILYIWDQRATTDTSAPNPYNYGKEWTGQQIDSGICTHNDYSVVASHGTNVAGIATGNGLAVNNYKGVAPEADIIIVATNYQDTSVVDAVDYIFRKADSLGQPCVINMSLGSYWGSHDGKDIYAQAINNMIAEKDGRVVVCAGGNGRKDSMHLHQDVTSDTSFTWFKYNYISPAHPQVWFFGWADTAEFDSVYFSIGVDDSDYVFLDETPYYSIDDILYGNVVDTLYNQNMGIAGIVYPYAVYENDSFAYRLNMAIVTDSIHYLWRFSTTGSGSFDVWSTTGNNVGTSNMVRQSELPTMAEMPEIINYTPPDNLQTITSSWTCAPNVITVANYNNRGTYLDADSVLQTAKLQDLPAGSIAASSSIGPTRDGRLKPEIAASGNTTIASGRLGTISLLLGSGQAHKVGFGSQHTRNGGTSMAAPIVSGIAALYLQKHPNADFQEVKDAILNNAKRDAFTGDTINDSWGYGKVYAFGVLADDTVLGCTDTGALNYDTFANVNDGSCVNKVYGCTDTSAFNYDPLANVDDNSCIPKIYGCTDSLALNYDSLSNTDDSSCIEKILGCTDTSAFNYDSLANVDDGSCVPKVYGCTDSLASNYDSLANIDDESCEYVGIKIGWNEGVKVYPNPFKDEIVVEHSYQEKKLRVNILNLRGQVVSNQTISNTRSKIFVKDESLIRGLYYLELVNMQGVRLYVTKLSKY